MKKICILTVMLVAFLQLSISNAQDTLKTFSNRWSTELNFNPFNGNLSFNNSTGQIKLRYFEPNGNAWRFAVTLSYNQNNSNTESVYGTNPYNNKNTQKSFFSGLNVGKEKHFSGSRRLSPYIGWEIGFGYKSSYEKIKVDNKTTEIKGAWIAYNQIENPSYPNSGSQYYTYQSYIERGYWSVSGNLVAGFDFYMSEKFYIGYELLFGLDYMSYSDIDITEKLSGTQQNNNNNTYPDLDDESWHFGPKLVNGIRIGFVF